MLCQLPRMAGPAWRRPQACARLGPLHPGRGREAGTFSYQAERSHLGADEVKGSEVARKLLLTFDFRRRILDT